MIWGLDPGKRSPARAELTEVGCVVATSIIEEGQQRRRAAHTGSLKKAREGGRSRPPRTLRHDRREGHVERKRNDKDTYILLRKIGRADSDIFYRLSMRRSVSDV